MSVFQIVAISILGVLIATSGYRLLRGSTRRRVVVFWLVLWVVALAAILVPERITDIAKLMGIKRGADLVLYSAVLTGLIGFFYIYLRLRALNRHITILTREIALLGATDKKTGEPSDDKSNMEISD